MQQAPGQKGGQSGAEQFVLNQIMSKIESVRSHFAALAGRLACPICRQPLKLQANSFTCPAGHCYDLSAQNYLNLAPQKNQTSNKYTTALFSARRQVFNAGLYNPLLQKILDYCTEYQTKKPAAKPIILDAGCGEGFFAANLLSRLPFSVEVLALDLAKDAVKMAAKTYQRAGLYCLIGDLANLPLADNSIDIIINMLSPASYGEFARVLKPDGLLIKVIPEDHYLEEVRNYLHIPPQKALTQQLAAKLWQQKLLNTQETILTYQRTIGPNLAKAFLQMGPLSFNQRPDNVVSDTELFSTITIDLKILKANI